MLTKEEALKKIKSLVERFDEQKEFYTKSDYNETQTRRDFIDPFWKALGWDVDNENGYAESYREVIHEDRVKVDGKTKAPDYSFRLPGGKRLFFLEAKKPSVSIKDDIEPAYQIRRYGWSAKMPISVISDFEEFVIYDCTQKPKPTDKASNGRIKYITYSNYLKEFDFIWDTFSKEKVLKGSFDKYITSYKNKKGTTTVDHDFLASLDKWRIELAKNIVFRNKNLNEDELNFVVQHTIDRIIFLRIAEDRHVEQYGELQDCIRHSRESGNPLNEQEIAGQARNDNLTPQSELTTAEKKRILLNNIFDVDLDSNAVEVTKLSLLLKCMEGETKETIEAQSRIFHGRILPTLDNNIKSGNSLIDLDYYDSQLDFGEERKIKPFSWQKAFPEALLTTSSNGKTRQTIFKNHSLSSIVTFDHFVFQEATIGATIFVANNILQETTNVYKMNSIGEFWQTQNLKLSVSEQPWETSLDTTSKELFEKIIQKSVLMKELVNMSKGMVVKNRNEVLENKPNPDNFPFLLGNCMNRYQLKYNKYANYNKLKIIGGTRVFRKQTITPKILIRRTGGFLCATYSDKKELIESTLYILTSDKINIKFLLGLINSNLLTYFLAKKLLTNTQGFPQVLMGQLEQLPIVQAKIQQEEQIIKYVDQLLQLNKDLQTATLPEKKEQLKSRIDYCEDKINEIVYELYGLTEEEIKIIEK